MTIQTDDEVECAACGAPVPVDAFTCRRCDGDPFGPRADQADDLGPEPEYKDHNIDQRCAPCRGCGNRFIEWDKGIAGDVARVYRDPESGRWFRYHVSCWPWA